MIGYIITGGIGDAILSVPVIEKVKSYFNDSVIVLCLDPNMFPLIFSTGNPVKCYEGEFSIEGAYSLLKTCSLVVWNRFEADNDGFNSFFYALDSSKLNTVRRMRETYHENLSKLLGRKVYDLRKEDHLFLMNFFSSEKNYYADWNRFGVDVSYDDLNITIPNEFVIKNKERVDSLGNYCIVHDSRIHSFVQNIKSWYFDRWQEVVNFILEEVKFEIVHIHTKSQPLLSGVISHDEIIGSEAQFFDYLYLLSRSKFYVGTDSWPGHAAIFLPQVKFVLLKGAVSRRWDHEGKCSSIIRKGNCQACEYIPLDKCIFDRGQRGCMKKIEVNDVVNEIKKIVDDKGIGK